MRVCIALFVRSRLLGWPWLAAAVALTFLTACHQRPAPELRRKVESELYTCSLNESAFPSEWQHLRSETYDIPALGLPGNALGGIDAVFGPHGPDPGVPAGHGILAYRTPQIAAITFQSFLGVFYDAGRLTPWVKPDVEQADLSADAFRVGCAYYRTYDADSSRKRCAFLARYGRILTTFRTWVSPEYMSEEEMVSVLEALDGHMLQCVDAFDNVVWKETVFE